MTRSAPHPRASPRARHLPPVARPAPVPPAPWHQERQPCTCSARQRSAAPCRACVSWDRGQVLLLDGGSMTTTQWAMLHACTAEVTPPPDGSGCAGSSEDST